MLKLHLRPTKYDKGKVDDGEEEEVDEITDIDILPVVVRGSCLIKSIDKSLQSTFNIEDE